VSLQNSELHAFERLAQKAISAQLLDDEVALATRGMSFRPLFLRVGIQQISAVEARVRSRLLQVLGQILSENSDFLAETSRQKFTDGPSLISSDSVDSKLRDVETLQNAEVRFSMHLLLQLHEMGIDLGDVILIIKSDLRSPDLVYAWRTFAEEGPGALLESRLFDDSAKLLWAHIFQGRSDAWSQLRRYLAGQYGLQIELIE
jgi:hypothetical protein